MLTPLIVITVCAFCFGLAWHNQPPRNRHRAEQGKDGSRAPDTQPSNS